MLTIILFGMILHYVLLHCPLVDKLLLALLARVRPLVLMDVLHVLLQPPPVRVLLLAHGARERPPLAVHRGVRAHLARIGKQLPTCSARDGLDALVDD